MTETITVRSERSDEFDRSKTYVDEHGNKYKVVRVFDMKLFYPEESGFGVVLEKQ